jgi:hypothetical protein
MCPSILEQRWAFAWSSRGCRAVHQSRQVCSVCVLFQINAANDIAVSVRAVGNDPGRGRAGSSRDFWRANVISPLEHTFADPAIPRRRDTQGRGLIGQRVEQNLALSPSQRLRKPLLSARAREVLCYR